MTLYLNVLKSVPVSSLVTRCAAPVSVCSVREFRWRYVNKKAKWYKRRRMEDKQTDWMWPLLQYKEELAKETDKPKQEPHMLHVAKLVKPIKGNPWWEKDALEELGLTKRDKLVPLKNIPSVNEKLRLVNHLIEVMPLKFPHGLPQEESDYQFCTIKSNGEMEVIRRLVPDETATKKKPGTFPLQKEVFQQRLAKQIVDNRVHMEYHKPKYVYKHNQDGKEYRYTQYPYQSNETKE